MESNSTLFKALAVLVTMINTGIIFVGFGAAIPTGILVNGNVLLVILFGFALLIFQWFAVLKADNSKGWAITLLVIAILMAIGLVGNLRVFSLIITIIYFVYSIQSLAITKR
ncbi:hypothetical protein RJG79_11555 [Mycoplasmatota bacterium WC44]